MDKCSLLPLGCYGSGGSHMGLQNEKGDSEEPPLTVQYQIN